MSEFASSPGMIYPHLQKVENLLGTQILSMDYAKNQGHTLVPKIRIRQKDIDGNYEINYRLVCLLLMLGVARLFLQSNNSRLTTIKIRS